MKRFCALILVALSLLSFAGCANSISNRTNFYYCNIDYQFGEDASVIQSESRDISGHQEDLAYLISLYLAGPSSKNLESPFPKSTKLISVQTENNSATIELSNSGRWHSDTEFILACACLTLSILEFTDAEQITVTSGEKNITMSKNDLLLYDTVTAQTPTEEAK